MLNPVVPYWAHCCVLTCLCRWRFWTSVAKGPFNLGVVSWFFLRYQLICWGLLGIIRFYKILLVMTKTWRSQCVSYRNRGVCWHRNSAMDHLWRSLEMAQTEAVALPTVVEQVQPEELGGRACDRRSQRLEAPSGPDAPRVVQSGRWPGDALPTSTGHGCPGYPPPAITWMCIPAQAQYRLIYTSSAHPSSLLTLSTLIIYQLGDHSATKINILHIIKIMN